MMRMAAQLVNAAKNFRYKLDKNGTEPVWEYEWTFQGAFLFSMTTLTLIGYGHIAPSTTVHRLECVAFTLIGLPLNVVFLANVGNAMADGFKYIYSRLCCRWCRVRRKATERHYNELNEEKDPADDIEEGENDAKYSVMKEEVGPEEYMPTQDVSTIVEVCMCHWSDYSIGPIFRKWKVFVLHCFPIVLKPQIHLVYHFPVFHRIIL